MKIYTLHYTDTKLFNKSVFVCPNDETAIKAMKLNLMDKTSPQSERFRDEVKLGNVELVSITEFDEDAACANAGSTSIKICNLKELLDDDGGNLTPVQ